MLIHNRCGMNICQKTGHAEQTKNLDHKTIEVGLEEKLYSCQSFSCPCRVSRIAATLQTRLEARRGSIKTRLNLLIWKPFENSI